MLHISRNVRELLFIKARLIPFIPSNPIKLLAKTVTH